MIHEVAQGPARLAAGREPGPWQVRAGSPGPRPTGLAGVVVPTARPERAARLLASLGERDLGWAAKVVLVDDRPGATGTIRVPAGLGAASEVLRTGGLGPAAARDAGWRAVDAEWVVFLDDDVALPVDWGLKLVDDLVEAGPSVGAVQARVEVPLPAERPPTDWERNVAGLAGARWITADMAVRRRALESVGGFDLRFRRAYREDSDLALRLLDRGWRIVRGSRRTVHPVGPPPPLGGLPLQAGNADDLLMDALHGPRWRERAGAPRGRLRRHLATASAGLAALLAAGAGIAFGWALAWAVAAVAALGWIAGTAELARARIAPGPRTPGESWRMAWTSLLMPFVATAYRLAGRVRLRGLLREPGPDPDESFRVPRERPAAVLFDRDGTLIEDVPYNGDPERVELRPGAAEAVERLRRAGLPMAVISNQSGIGRGKVGFEQVDAVNARVERELGPVGPWLYCPHRPSDGCDCRKPLPGLVDEAAAALGFPPDRCAVIGDIGSDVWAAQAAGARAVLVPTGKTLPEEVEMAPEVAPDLGRAVTMLLREDAR